MSARRLILGLAFCAAAVALAAPGGAPPPADASADEALLQTAQIGTDGPALLAYFRQRVVAEADRQRIASLIRQLGDSSYALRERASVELVGCGLPAIGPLRQALNDPDVEIARRAERCLQRIERVPSTALSAAAARLIAQRKPAGAAGVLLAYLPLSDDEGVADEVREAIAATAVTEGRLDPVLVPALEDTLPVKRAAAAEALIRSGRPEAIEQGRKVLADRNAEVRLRAALALVAHAKDRKTVPELIRMLGELPQGSGWRIEELLIRLAGDQAPAVALGNDEAARRKCQDAWLTWWEKNGGQVDLAKIGSSPALLSYTLVVLRTPNDAGRVIELNARNEVLWTIDGLRLPWDAVVVGKDRILIAEYTGNEVSEREFNGRPVWKKAMSHPTQVQRLPNGNTFVVSRSLLVEWDAQRKEVFNYPVPKSDIIAAQKLRTGEIVYLNQSGELTRLDAKGNTLKTISTGIRAGYSFGDLEVLPNGRFLMTQVAGVTELDPDGRTSRWNANFNLTSSVQRLPNGNTLVASSQQPVVELDRNGQRVWEYKPPDGYLPWKARRR